MKNTSDNRNLIAAVMDCAKAHQDEGDMASSAQYNYRAACETMHPLWHSRSDSKKNRELLDRAAYYALRSLSYSIGMLHGTYQAAERTIQAAS